MIETESYGVSGRQLLSSKQVPDSGRVCSWRKPRVWPSSWPMMLAGVQDPDVKIESSIRMFLVRLLGKNARAMYCVVFTGWTAKRTLLFLVVQLPFWAGT